jgi:hypothetical protein
VKLSSRILTVLMLFALASCASLKLPAPTDNDSTLLLLPFILDSQSQHGGPLAFHYVYEIVSADGAGLSHQAVFTQRLGGDVLVVDSLPPGYYRLATFSFIPAGSGDHSYDNNRVSRPEHFWLEAGKITIFPRALTVRRYNATPGRGMTTTYARSITTLSTAKRQEIVQNLSELPHFDEWQLQDESSAVGKAIAAVPKPAIVPAPAVAAVPAVMTGAVVDIDVSGRYRSNISSSSHHIFPRRYQDAEIEIRQSGDRIVGSDESGGFEINGNIEAGIIRYYLKPTIVTGYYNVSGEWEIEDSGDRLSGFWKDSRGDGPGQWELIRLD